MTFEEYYAEKMDEYRSYALQNGTSKEYEFLRSCLDATVDYGDLESYEILEKEIDTVNWQPDAISFNTEFSQLIIIVSIFSDTDLKTSTSLTKTEINNSFTRSKRFIDRCKKDPNSVAKLNTNLYHVAQQIKDSWNAYKNIRILIVSNKVISTRVDNIQQKDKIEDKNVVFGIWDLSRFFNVESSQTEREEIIVDFTDNPLATLEASSTDEMQSYLVMMPATKLAEIYGLWKSRILEQNVRSYLQNRSNVNKGILLTLEQNPSRFFAYNNGITTTGERLEFDASGKKILKIHNLQIVNGGQTTASIYRASVQKTELSEVNVQMKLSVIEKDKVSKLVPKIAEFANKQNPVNAADLGSNHPYHQKIEILSRKLIPPPQENQVGLGKWFYERSRGQYLNEQNDKTPSQRKEFQRHNPKTKQITKTDLGLTLNSWLQKPYHVSKGAQANFKEFIKSLPLIEEWDNNNAQYNEDYFYTLIAKTIIMRSLRNEVPKQEWYKGIPANVVTYSISWLSLCMEKSKVGINSQLIWRNQSCPIEILEMLLLFAEQINTHLQSFEGNPTTYAKSERCWKELISKLHVEILQADGKNFIDVSEIKSAEGAAKKEQKKINKLLKEINLYQIDKNSWEEIYNFMLKYNKMSPNKDRLIRSLQKGEIPDEKLLNIILKDVNEYIKLGGKYDYKT